MYYTHNKGKSVAAERFIITLKNKIYKEMIANDKKTYHSYLNMLVDDYNNTCCRSIDKKPINIDYSTLTEKTETNLKTPKFKVDYGFEITKYKNIFSKGYTKNWTKEIFVIESV